MRKTRTALQADERWLHESSFSPSFCPTVLVYQPVRLTALERRYPDDRDESLSGQAAHEMSKHTRQAEQGSEFREDSS
jgi:hypothetical protein